MTDERIEAAFVEKMNTMIIAKDGILASYDELIAELTDTTALDARLTEATQDAALLREKMQRYVAENASNTLDQDEYNVQYDAMDAKYNDLKRRIADIEEKILDKRGRRVKLTAFIETLRAMDGLLTQFDEGLWCATVESVSVDWDGKMTFRFMDGREG